MKKCIYKQKIIQYSFIILLIGLLFAFIGYSFYLKMPSNKKIEASTVVTTNDFRLTTNNKWDNTVKRNYAQLDWENIPNLTQSGYKLYQSAEGGAWENRSLSYGKSIRVLNVYPNREDSNTLQRWMDGLGLEDSAGNNLIQVTPVTFLDFNNNSNSILKNGEDYQYDVIMFGSWDGNNNVAISEQAAESTVDFIEAGRGVLFGHDTVISMPQGNARRTWWRYFYENEDYLGIGHDIGMETNGMIQTRYMSGSDRVRIINGGYLMKYPFEMENEMILRIPYTHNIELSNKNVGITWAEIHDPHDPNGTFDNDIHDDDHWRGGWYLKTNDNVAMIQTGHDRGQSSEDEQQIIANVLYNLAQVSIENDATDYTVIDDQSPEAPEMVIRCGDEESLNIRLNSQDNGKEYHFKVEADTKDQGLLTSDVVRETIISNIAGYFYEVSDSPTSNLATEVEARKDAYGRIDPNDFDLYVAPNDDSVKYETSASFTLSEENTSGKYIHVLAVDRANNVSAVTSQQIRDITQPVDFEIERTADEAKLVEVELDSSVEDKMKSIEIQIPKNTEIKDFASLTLPMDWYSFENSETVDYYSFSFAMEDNNSAATIKDFLEELRFTITDPVDASGSIKVILHEKVYTYWIDGDGTTHYYVFIEDTTEPGTNWFQAYNEAKKLRYRGLTGYLATITSEEEHDFIFDNIAKEAGLLGGTRALLADGNAINDDSTVPQTIGGYDIEQNNWYWATGPEVGDQFFIGKTRAEGQTPPNAYSSFAQNEPNNFFSGDRREYILQFAKDDSKHWNDLPGDLGCDQRSNHGYYVEFSEYGGQTEGEEITDVCWKAAIPQKINIQAYTERIGQPDPQRFTRGDIVYDQQLRIGDQITAQPNEFELFAFLEHRDRSGAMVLPGARPLGDQYTVTKDFQEGAFIYANRQVMLHVRQVVLEPENQLVNPEEGYLNLKSSLYDVDSGNHVEDLSQLIQTQIPSQTTEEVPDFETFVVSTKHMVDEMDILSFNLILPEFYEYAGNFITPRHFEDPNDPMGADHQDKTESDIYGGTIEIPRVGLDLDREYFITLYIKPTTAGKTPQPYSWDYKKNDLGEIKTQ